MIYFFMNVDGLIAGRRASNPLHNTSLLRGFISGFTLSLVAPLVHIVDVGQARDVKDSKIEGTLTVYLRYSVLTGLRVQPCFTSS